MAQVTDPVCGMTIESDTAAARERHGDHFHYFCSSECARAFRDTPEQYTAAERGSGLDVVSKDAVGDAPLSGGELDVERVGKAPVNPKEGLDVEHVDPMPPRTTEGGVTAPMFGSAGSGGAELERLPGEDERP